MFRGMVGLGELTKECSSPPFDYLTFETLYDASYEGPGSFEGYSGSGIWQLLGKRVDGKMQFSERLLSGVAFHQSDMIKRDQEEIREITCHGRKSIYGMLIDTVRGELLK